MQLFDDLRIVTQLQRTLYRTYNQCYRGAEFVCDISEECYFVKSQLLYLVRHPGKLRFLPGNLFVLLLQHLVLAGQFFGLFFQQLLLSFQFMGTLLHFLVQPFFLLFQTPYAPLVELPCSEGYENDNEQHEPSCFIKIGLDCNLKLRYIFFFCLGIGRIFHLQRVVARGQVGIGCKAPVAGHMHPLVVKTKQAIAVSGCVVGLEVECGKFQ